MERARDGETALRGACEASMNGISRRARDETQSNPVAGHALERCSFFLVVGWIKLERKIHAGDAVPLASESWGNG